MINFHNKDNKPVMFGYFQQPIVDAMNLAAIWSARSGYDVRITSGNDRTHLANSLHYIDRAFDYVIDGLGRPMDELTVFLQTQLGPGYDIVWNVEGHFDHGHLEWDIKQRPRRSLP